MKSEIEIFIDEKLTGEMKTAATEFVQYINSLGLAFKRDMGPCWKDKIYYHVKYNDKCVCFIAIADIEEPNNLWTVWSEDSLSYANGSIDEDIKSVGWNHVDHCGNCGSCGGGKEKIIFGKCFPRVCGCTFRVDNAGLGELPFLKTMVELKLKDIVKTSAVLHYDLLVDEGNDPVRDPKPLRDYMDKWDGEDFICRMELSGNKSVLEIGVGTGRLGIRVAPKCGEFWGIDISRRSVERARENLAGISNAEIICGDFTDYDFERTFDVVYSSLTFMHLEDKQTAVAKAAGLLNSGGRFVLSIDNNPGEFIDMGSRKVRIYPDNGENIENCIKFAGLNLLEKYKTEFATVFVAEKN